MSSQWMVDLINEYEALFTSLFKMEIQLPTRMDLTQTAQEKDQLNHYKIREDWL